MRKTTTIVSALLSAALVINFASAQEQVDIVAPTVDGMPTLASIPMPGNKRVFLTEAKGKCSEDYQYGMLADVETGDQPAWFCWRLDLQRGVIRSSDDDYSVAVEDFNWTAAGNKYLKRMVN